MGCKSSKDAAEDKFLNMEVKKIGVGQVDALFDNIKEALDTCEFIRAGLEDSRDEGARIAHTDRLVNGKYEDTLQVMLWALSANANGAIKSIDIKVSGESPYLGLNKDKLSEECQKLYKTFETYVKTILESPVKLVTTIDKLTELNNQVPDAMNAAKSEIQGGSASFKEKLDGIAGLAKNAKAAGSKIVKCKALKDVLSQSAEDLKAFVGKLKDMVDKADEVGAKAHKAGHLSLKEIFEHYHTGEKKKEEPKKEQPKK